MVTDTELPPLPTAAVADQGLETPTGATQVPDMRSLLETIRQAGAESFQREIDQAGSPVTWFRSRCPRVASAGSFSSDGMEERLLQIVARETQAFWTGLEQRLAECERCPSDGAACEGSLGRVSPGRVVEPRLLPGDVPSSVESPCARYREYRMAQKLESLGVPGRFSRVTMQEIKPSAEAKARFSDVIESVALARGVSLYIEGKYARAFGAALLRNLVRHCPSAFLRSVHIGSVMRESYDAMQSKQPSPLLDLTEPDALVLDGAEVELGLKKRATGALDFAGREMRYLYERRRDQNKTTVVTSMVDVREVFPGIAVLRV